MYKEIVKLCIATVDMYSLIKFYWIRRQIRESSENNLWIKRTKRTGSNNHTVKMIGNNLKPSPSIC